MRARLWETESAAWRTGTGLYEYEFGTTFWIPTYGFGQLAPVTFETQHPSKRARLVVATH